MCQKKYLDFLRDRIKDWKYADIVYLPSPKYPDKPALLVELKCNKTVKTAANQIRVIFLHIEIIKKQ